jgi:hypothetical protein
MRRIALLTLWMVASTLATSAQVSYTFTRLDVPGSSLTRAHGINFRGDIVGLFQHNGGHGFLRHNGTYTTIDFPGATFTSARGINSSGAIKGGLRRFQRGEPRIQAGGRDLHFVQLPRVNFHRCLRHKQRR